MKRKKLMLFEDFYEGKITSAYSRKNRRFQLRSLHTMLAFPCTPIIKDAIVFYKTAKVISVLFLRICCGFELPVPYNSFSMCSSKKSRVHKKAPHWVRALLTSLSSLLLDAAERKRRQFGKEEKKHVGTIQSQEENKRMSNKEA